MSATSLGLALGAALLATTVSVRTEAQTTAAPLLAQACAGCHGQAGAGVAGMPAIAGTDRETFLATWAAFRTDQRSASIMNRIARGYTEAEVAVLADYFSSRR
jgi:cytochrome subunit of sulfide dehydrogenase